jgi:hypothetical protein
MQTYRVLFLAAPLGVLGAAIAQGSDKGADFAMPDVVIVSSDDVIADDANDATGATPVADGTPQRVDLFVPYTPAARAYAGSTNAMKAAINTYVAATNTAYTNSDINVVLKLVGTAEVSYVEAGDMSTDLSRLRSTTDSYLTTVPGLRDTHRADLVCLIRRDGAAGVAGIGYLGNLTSGFSSSAYSVVADVWAVGNNSFPHELGHNYGCHHDHANGSGAARAYAYGHRFNGTNAVQYRTIMAYAPGTRISYFSNPSITYQGTATGVGGTGATAADNARLIEESSVVTRTFRNGGARLGGLVCGDLNNDGKVDLLLSDQSTGERHAWLMNGAARSSATVFYTVDSAWRLAATGDFNADNKTDLVWEHTSTGSRSIWVMNGTTRSSTVSLGTVALDWRVAGAGDFDGDGKTDLVWQNNASGVRTVWLMNGTSRTSTANLGTVATNWRIGAVGDLNGDNKPDLVWSDSNSGGRSVWFMDGTTRTSSASLGVVPQVWQLSGAGDVDRDGKTDLLWENSSSKARSVWYMNGTTRTSSATLPPPEI